MNKRRIFFSFLGFVLLCICAWLVWPSAEELQSAKKSLKSSVEDTLLSTASPEDVAALALKNIDLKQGEHGIELWRLKADWGKVQREGELLSLQQPNFVYFMPPDNNELRINANTGEVFQKDKRIRFVNEVIVAYGEGTLTTGLLIYDGGEKNITFPEGALFQGENLQGEAPYVVWDLDTQTLSASGGVNIRTTLRDGQAW